MCNSPVPCAEKQPHIVMLPSPCFTVGMAFIHATFLSPKKRIFLIINLRASVQILFPPISFVFKIYLCLRSWLHTFYIYILFFILGQKMCEKLKWTYALKIHKTKTNQKKSEYFLSLYMCVLEGTCVNSLNSSVLRGLIFIRAHCTSLPVAPSACW